MSKAIFVVGLVLWTLVLGALYVVAVKKIAANNAIANNTGAKDPEAEPEQEQEGVEATQQTFNISFPSRKLPEFELTECMGGTVSGKSLMGKRWLANFVFTRCVTTCPMITRDISELHRVVATKNPEFKFVTFTVDPGFDTATVLRKYAETFQADHERWKFVTGDEAAIHDLIRGGFVQYVKPNTGDERMPGFEVDHSNRAVLVNEAGIPVGSFLMNIPSDVAKLRRIIEGKEDFPVPSVGLKFSATNGDNPAVPLTLIPVKDDNDEATDSKGDEDESEPKEIVEPAKTPDSNSSATEGDTEAAITPQVKNQEIDARLPGWAATMPTINAVLNSTCIVLLLCGLAAIKGGNRIRHRNLMIVSFVVSVAFLVCYLTYHEVLHRFTGYRGRAFDGSSTATRAYFSILIPHVILAAIVPILALRVFYLAFRERWPEHRILARITLPIWLFVSITGVVIYGMLYHWPWPGAAVSLSAAQ